MSFNKKKCIDNILFLAKKKGIKIGDLETEAGVSAGYLARINKESSTAMPSIELLTAISEKLNISIDSLIHQNLASLSEEDEYVMSFVNKLYLDTALDSVPWDCEPIKQLGDSLLTEDGEVHHPLFEVRNIEKFDKESGTNRNCDAVVFCSKYRPNTDFYEDYSDIYCTDIFGSRLYIVKTFLYGTASSGKYETYDEYELYIVSDKKVDALCHSNYEHPTAFNDILCELYSAAAEASAKPKISTESKKNIDLFMEGLPF